MPKRKRADAQDEPAKRVKAAGHAPLEGVYADRKAFDAAVRSFVDDHGYLMGWKEDDPKWPAGSIGLYCRERGFLFYENGDGSIQLFCRGKQCPWHRSFRHRGDAWTSASARRTTNLSAHGPLCANNDNPPARRSAADPVEGFVAGQASNAASYRVGLIAGKRYETMDEVEQAALSFLEAQDFVGSWRVDDRRFPVGSFGYRCRTLGCLSTWLNGRNLNLTCRHGDCKWRRYVPADAADQIWIVRAPTPAQREHSPRCIAWQTEARSATASSSAPLAQVANAERHVDALPVPKAVIGTSAESPPELAVSEIVNDARLPSTLDYDSLDEPDDDEPIAPVRAPSPAISLDDEATARPPTTSSSISAQQSPPVRPVGLVDFLAGLDQRLVGVAPKLISGGLEDSSDALISLAKDGFLKPFLDDLDTTKLQQVVLIGRLAPFLD